MRWRWWAYDEKKGSQERGAMTGGGGVCRTSAATKDARQSKPTDEPKHRYQYACFLVTVDSDDDRSWATSTLVVVVKGRGGWIGTKHDGRSTMRR